MKILQGQLPGVGRCGSARPPALPVRTPRSTASTPLTRTVRTPAAVKAGRLVGRTRRVKLRIEDDHVGEGAGLQPPASIEMEGVGGESRAALDELRARSGPARRRHIRHICARSCRKRADVPPRRRNLVITQGWRMNALMSASVWLNDATAGSSSRMTAIAASISVLAPAFGDVGERASAQAALGDQQRSRSAAAPAQILGHVGAKAAGEAWIVEALEQRRPAAVLRPARDQRGRQARARGGPGILVGGDGLARAPRRFDSGDDRRRLALNVDARAP